MDDPSNREPGGLAEATLELLAAVIILIGGGALVATILGLFLRVVVWAWSW